MPKIDLFNKSKPFFNETLRMKKRKEKKFIKYLLSMDETVLFGTKIYKHPSLKKHIFLFLKCGFYVITMRTFIIFDIVPSNHD